jgi:hypothetical protein
LSLLSKIWVWDPGSGKNLFRIPDPGVKKAPDPGSGSATLVKKLKNWINYGPILQKCRFSIFATIPDEKKNLN